MKFRKKPVVIEAFRYLVDEVPQWWRDHKGIRIEPASGCAFIPTLEGIMTAAPTDWIIKGIKGEIYPCKADIFEATYKPVNEGGCIFGRHDWFYWQAMNKKMCRRCGKEVKL